MTDPEEISSETPDWDREQPTVGWDPGRMLLRSIRQYQKWKSQTGPVAFVVRRMLVLRHRFWSVVTGADIPLNCNIGGGLLIPHPNGIVIHPGAKIGVNCLILQQVTIGVGTSHDLPDIGGHVDVGAGAKILGGVRIGSHSKIGANAVVIDDVPAGATVVGIPARLLARPTATSNSRLD